MRHSASDFVDLDDVARAKGRSPHARQLCPGSMAQLMQDAGASVECPKCLKTFDVFDVQKNRSQRCPIVPSHLPDPAGRTKVEMVELKKTRGSGPRPY